MIIIKLGAYNNNMPSFYRQNNKRVRNEIQIKDFLGLRSSPANITPPNALNVAENLYFSQKGVLDTRPDINVQYTESAEGWVYNAVEFTASNGTNYLVYPRGRKLVYTSSGTSYNLALYAASENIFSNTEVIRDICSAFNAVFIVDGSQYIYKFNGAIVTRQTMPDYATYGNPVSICYFFNSLFVITDLGYLRYTAYGTEDVWETRTLLPGTVSTSTNTVTGTGTIFYANQLEPGNVLLFVNGATTEYGKISTVSSNTSLTLSTNLSNTFSAGTSIYLIGSTNTEPIERSDGLVPRKLISFGNFLALSKSSDSLNSSDSKLLVLDFQAQQDTDTLLTRVRRISTGYNLHPYSLCEWEDSLLFWTDRGLYSVTSPASDAAQIKPNYLTDSKLEDYTNDLALQKRNLTRISRINNNKKNLIAITTTLADNVDYADTILVGFEAEPFNFEFTELSFPTYIIDDDVFNAPTEICYVINFLGQTYIITRLNLFIFGNTTLGYDLVPDLMEAVFADSVTIFADNEDLLADNAGVPYGGTTQVPIKKLCRFGALTNEQFNDLTVSKFYITAEEQAAGPVFPVSFFTLKHILDDADEGFITPRVYADGLQVADIITCDNNIITCDNDTITCDSDIGGFTQARKIEYFCNTRGITSVALQIEDSFSTGRLKLWSYGFIVQPTKWAT